MFDAVYFRIVSIKSITELRPKRANQVLILFLWTVFQKFLAPIFYNFLCLFYVTLLWLNSIAVCISLLKVTCPVFGIFWFKYKIMRWLVIMLVSGFSNAFSTNYQNIYNLGLSENHVFG